MTPSYLLIWRCYLHLGSIAWTFKQFISSSKCYSHDLLEYFSKLLTKFSIILEKGNLLDYSDTTIYSFSISTYFLYIKYRLMTNINSVYQEPFIRGFMSSWCGPVFKVEERQEQEVYSLGCVSFPLVLHVIHFQVSVSQTQNKSI